jgi:hypothetical protein
MRATLTLKLLENEEDYEEIQTPDS